MSTSSINCASQSSARSSTAKGTPRQDVSTMPSVKELRYLDPCAATASMFLYAQGRSVICCHHDTLTVERKFSKHTDDVQLLAVDNHSELGAGRLVVSYDAGQTAIVWDLMTGHEVARFTSYDHLTVAAWMRNGNVAFGNTQGSIILFEPTTSEHISSRTIDQIAVTALAPSSDCRTFAIGYQNGSLLIATLQPRFTILHNLTTSRGPSPIVTLAWHASSSRQKSDMLAVQTHDGDLRVWSVAKSYNVEDPAKVVRILRRGENFIAGANWMGWSKNGRIIQYSDSETLSWDVRTKHVTFDSIPTLEHVKGIAVYGPGATLFTLGPECTVQQFDLNSPSIMVNSVHHALSLLPPSPPNSVEEPGAKVAQSVTIINTSESDTSSVPIEVSVSESDDDHLSPFARLARQQVLDSGTEQSYDSGSPVSSRSGLSSLSKSSAGSRTPGQHHGSVRSRGLTENTYISTGTSLKSSTVGKREADTYSMGYSLGTTSVSSLSSSRPRHRPSRLRHEVPRSPDDNKVHDLFKFTRTRLSDIPYKHPMNPDNSRLTNDDLRRQMLSTIFGWQKDVEDLVRDEMTRHPAGSASRILLAKWLGNLDADILAGSSENMTSSDWMLLALSGIGSQQSQHKLGRAYVQKLLESGDVHVAVTIMLGMGDHNDAIEVYVSHKRYMEALLLTCISFPGVWERQAAIVRKWGEWAVQHGQQQLAIRCFACTDQESTEPWTSPSAVQLNFQSITPSIPEVLSPPLSPPGVQRGPQRSIAKSSALKLITSFGDQSQKSRFYSHGDGGQTPIAAGVTPIADSAISPGGSYEAATAFLRPSSNSRFNTPTSARPGGFGRVRLPSIGEMTADIKKTALRSMEKEREKEQEKEVVSVEVKEPRHGHARAVSASQDNLAVGTSTPRASTASPMMMRDRFKRAAAGQEGDRPLSPDQGILIRMKEARSNSRNGSRDRIPRGVNLHVQTEQTSAVEVASPEQSVSSSTRFHWPTRRRGPGSIASSITSNSSAGRSLRNPRHRDDYIHSLDVAQNYPRNKSRHSSKERAREASRGRHGSRERSSKSKEESLERGRTSARGWTKPKRSPTSPIPMSPEDLANLSTVKSNGASETIAARRAGGKLPRMASRTSSRGSDRKSPDGRPRPLGLDFRGRADCRETSYQRSPSSPLPLSANAIHYQGSEDEEDFKKAMREQEDFRAKHSRSSSRGLHSPSVARRERSESRRREAEEPDGRPAQHQPVNGRAMSTEHAGDLRRMKDERQRKKEEAARELEERRKSLAKRPQAPQIPHPNDISSPGMRIGVETSDLTFGSGNPDVPLRSATEPPKSTFARSGPHIGLPATPKAMRLIMESDNSGKNGYTTDMPPIPLTFAQRHSPNTSPDKEKRGELLTLLPSTVYQPPPRPLIPRSMSAPIPDESHPPRFARKASTGEAPGIDEILGIHRRRSHEEPMPPPPPPAPAPPVLKELQHLALPPPPPPAPLPYAQRQQNQGAIGSGMIEIVMDDDEKAPMMAAPNDGMVPVILPPAPPLSRHRRGRSIGDGSLSGRLSKASERIRSASRGPRDANRNPKSPALDNSQSCGMLSNIQLRYPTNGTGASSRHDTDMLSSSNELNGQHAPTGLHRSEMI
ncbi:hypothetical protein HIM_00042 [Hirsutella minnesotensis 3608]|nr:hypothetical protein HIM_00042 [Hirsutella minnesotensis 3608]